MPVIKKVNKDFFKKWTPEMSYILGFFAADGYITVNRRGGQFWCIQIADRELLETIRVAVGSDHSIGIRKGAGREKDQYRLQIGSIEMCDDLRKLGYDERKTKGLSVPKVPWEHFPDFVRGYFDGDGGVWTGLIHKERSKPLLAIRAAFTSCSYGFLSALKDRLKVSGVDLGVIRRDGESYSRLTYSIHGSLKLYYFMYNREMPLIKGLFLERKRKVFEEYAKMRA